MAKHKISTGYAYYLERNGKPPLRNHRAVLWLERHGFSFGCQFGWMNAPQRMRQAKTGQLKPHPMAQTKSRRKR